MGKITLHTTIFITSLVMMSCGSLPFFGDSEQSDSTAAVQPDLSEQQVGESVNSEDELSKSDQAGNSLREQMQRLEANQEQMATDIKDVQNRLSRIESDVQTIRDYVMNEDPLAGDAITGAPVDTNVDASTFILPDEEVDTTNTTGNVIDITEQVLDDNAESNDVIANDAEEAQATETAAEPRTRENQPASLAVKYPEDYKLALQYFAKRRYDDAAQLLKMVTESSPSMIVRTNAHYWLGECQYAMGNYNEAITQFDLFMENKMSPKTDQALLLKAESLLKLGENKPALELYQYILETYPNSDYIARARKMVQIIDVESEN